MSSLYDSIIDEISQELNISKYEVERIVSSQFRVIENVITSKQCKTINCIYLGKFYPTAYRRKLEDGKTGRNI